MARLDPPEHERCPVRFLEPLRAFAYGLDVTALIDVGLERFDGLPNRQVEDNLLGPNMRAASSSAVSSCSRQTKPELESAMLFSGSSRATKPAITGSS